MNMKVQLYNYVNSGITVASFVSIAILLLLNTSTPPLDGLAKSGGLSANSVNSANVTAHTIGNLSKLKSGGLSANSVNSANVTNSS